MFLENGPPGPHTHSILLEFCLKQMIEGCEYFLKTIENELNLQGKLNDEHVKNIEAQNSEMKHDI